MPKQELLRGSRGLPQARKRPPLTQIWSGNALNELLDRLYAVQKNGLTTSFMALDKNVLERINVSNVSGGSVELFKNKLDWPRAFQGKTFEQERDLVNEAAQEAVKQATTRNRVDGDLVVTLAGGIDQLEAKLKEHVDNVPLSEYVAAKQYLRHLEDATKALKRPDVASYFDRTYSAKGRTVAQLVRNMTAENLRFSPATPGSEQDYLKLYQALATCALVTLQQQAAGD